MTPELWKTYDDLETFTMPRCPDCGTWAKEGTAACPDCGSSPLEETQAAICPECGHIVALEEWDDHLMLFKEDE